MGNSVVSTDIHVHQRINPYDFGDHLTFPLVLPFQLPKFQLIQ